MPTRQQPSPPLPSPSPSPAGARLIATNPPMTAAAESKGTAVGVTGSTSQLFGSMRSERMASGTVSDMPTVATEGEVSSTAAAQR